MLSDCSKKNLERMRRIVVKRINRSNLPFDVKIIAKYMPIRVKVINQYKDAYEGLAYFNKHSGKIAYIHLIKNFVIKYSFKRILETYAHEFAHIIDAYMRSSNLGAKHWHDLHWQRLNWICGGDIQNYNYKPRKNKNAYK